MPEPNGPLWTAVKAVSDPWPPDDEIAALGLGRALGRGAEAMARGAREATSAGAEALASWRDAAGEKFGGLMDGFARSAGQVDQSIRDVAAHAEKYGRELEAVKTAITNTIVQNERAFAQLANPLLGTVGKLMQQSQASKIAAELKKLVEQKAAELAGSPLVQNASGNVQLKGPNAGVEGLNPKLAVDGAGVGKDRFGRGPAANPGDFLAGGGVKAFANLAEVKASGQTNADGVTLSGTATGNIGVNGKAIAGISQDGATIGLSGQAGITGTVEGKADYGILGAKATGTGFAGAEAEANLTAGKEGLSGDVGAFAGAKARGSLGGDVGGIGAGVAGEAWAGVGAQADFKAGIGEDGKFHLGGEAGAGLGVGAKVGGEITVDPAKVAKTVSDAANAVSGTVNDAATAAQDTAESVGNTARDVARGVGDLFN